MPNESHEPKLGAVLTGRTVGPIRLLATIGSGSFAIVYHAQSLTNPRTYYAVKCLFKSGLTAEQLQIQRTEAQFLFALRGHENIVTLHETIETDEHLFLVLEECGGDLFDAVESRGGFSDDLVRDVFGQLCDAVEYSHDNGVYHRDLKPENVLVVYGDETEGYFDSDTEEDEEEPVKEITVKLTDFGLATTDAISTEYGCGSIRYMAPECLSPSDDIENTPDTTVGYASAPADTWALGIVLINMLTGQNPWTEPSKENDPLYAAYRDTDPDIFRVQFGFSAELNKILDRVFNLEPAKRPTPGELKEQILKCKKFFDPVVDCSDEQQSRAVRSDLNINVKPANTLTIPAIDTPTHASWSSDVSEMNFDELPVFAPVRAAPEPIPTTTKPDETEPAKMDTLAVPVQAREKHDSAIEIDHHDHADSDDVRRESTIRSNSGKHQTQPDGKRNQDQQQQPRIVVMPRPQTPQLPPQNQNQNQRPGARPRRNHANRRRNNGQKNKTGGSPRKEKPVASPNKAANTTNLTKPSFLVGSPPKMSFWPGVGVNAGGNGKGWRGRR